MRDSSDKVLLKLPVTVLLHFEVPKVITAFSNRAHGEQGASYTSLIPVSTSIVPEQEMARLAWGAAGIRVRCSADASPPRNNP